MGTVDDTGWTRIIFTTAKEILNVKIEEWACIVNELGANVDDRELCAEHYIDEIKKFADLMLVDMKKTYENVRLENKKLLNKIIKLSEELGRDVPPVVNGGARALYDKGILYRETIKELQEEAEDRRRFLNVLKERHIKVCAGLDIEQFEFNVTPLPSREDMANYAGIIEKLELEYSKRFKRLKQIRDELKALTEEIGYKPALDFEDLVLNGDLNDFTLSNKLMERLREFRDDLTKRRKELFEEITSLRSNLRFLYETLNGDMHAYRKFVEAHKTFSYANLEAYKHELKQWDEIKTASFKSLIRRTRNDLIDLWVKCGISKDERNEKLINGYEDNSEDTLHILESEVESMRSYYERFKQIFKTIKKRDEYLKKLAELESRTDAPNRFKNRGGQLLKEEKQRNALTKKISQIEEELMIMACKYEMEMSNPFKYWGQTMTEYIKQNNSVTQLERRVNNLNLNVDVKETHSKLKIIPVYKRLEPTAPKRAFLSFTKSIAVSSKTIHARMAPRRSILSKCTINGNNTISSSKPPGIKKVRYSIEKEKHIERVRRLSKIIREQRSFKGNEHPSETESEADKQPAKYYRI